MMARRFPLAALLLLAGAAGAQEPGRRSPGGGMMRGGYADPSSVISAEIAFSQSAAERGERDALARVSAKDAILFKPEPVFAQSWLKARGAQTASLRWRTQRVFMSCDGSATFSQGVWTRSDGTTGHYHNLWRRDRKRGYLLLLSQERPSADTRDGVVRSSDDELEAITANIAYCTARSAGRSPPLAATSGVPVALDPKQPAPLTHQDASNDGSLRWRWEQAADGAYSLSAWMRTEKGEQSLIDNISPAGATGAQTSRGQ